MAPVRSQPLAPVTVEGARILFRNFAGKEDKFNKAGDRNFCVLLDDETSDNMKLLGWNVKYLKPREEDEDDHPQAYIQVAVSYKSRPPKVMLITEKPKSKQRPDDTDDERMQKTSLDESLVEIIDYSDIKTVDLVMTPYQWEVNGNTGVKAYLKSIFVTLNEDDLDRKYSGIDNAENEGSNPEPDSDSWDV